MISSKIFRNFVGHGVVNADLQVFEPRAVQPLDALGRQQVTVGDQPRNHAAPADVRDHFVQFRVEQRLAPADGDDGGAHIGQQVEPPLHLAERHRLREIVKLIAICAGEIAAADGDDVRQDGVTLGQQPFCDHPPFAQAGARKPQLAAKRYRRRGLDLFLSCPHEITDQISPVKLYMSASSNALRRKAKSHLVPNLQMGWSKTNRFSSVPPFDSISTCP